MPTEYEPSSTIALFLSGDVMTGRGIDQVLPRPGDPRLYEGYVKDARDYVVFAEQANGKIDYPVSGDYLWGDGLEELHYFTPDVRIINLETAVTIHDQPWPGKGIHYKMHPGNVGCLTAADIDCCVLANNHVLDWGYVGLSETLSTLHAAGIRCAGAGASASRAASPAILPAGNDIRVLVFAYGLPSSGVPPPWAAAVDKAGVNLLAGLGEHAVRQVKRDIAAHKQQGDVIVVSLHWGGNWGYALEPTASDFAHALIDRAEVDVIHGHSSHHPRAVEVYKDKPILYGCGDLINDYEGIRGYEQFRPDLALMYFLTFDSDALRLVDLHMSPMQLRRFRLQRATEQDSRWLQHTLEQQSQSFGTHVDSDADARLEVRWRS